MTNADIDTEKEHGSAELVQDIWQDFARWFERQHGSPVSKSLASTMYLGGRDKLARWTKPGHRANWRIPLASIDAFCDDFMASRARREALFRARLLEIHASNGGQPTPETVAFMWGAEFSRVDLSQSEQMVLDAFRAEAQRWPRGLYLDEVLRLEKWFSAMLRRAERLFSEEDRAGNEDAQAGEYTAKRRAYEQKLQEAQRRRTETMARVRKSMAKNGFARKMLRDLKPKPALAKASPRAKG